MRREYSEEIKKRLKVYAEQDLYLKRKPRADFLGARFGRLVVIRAVAQDRHRRVIVLSHCDCGGAKICALDNLKGGVKSCGCLQEELKPALKRQRVFTDLLIRTLKKE